jgi:hypothetical protein
MRGPPSIDAGMQCLPAPAGPKVQPARSVLFCSHHGGFVRAVAPLPLSEVLEVLPVAARRDAAKAASSSAARSEIAQ